MSANCTLSGQNQGRERGRSERLLGIAFSPAARKGKGWAQKTDTTDLRSVCGAVIFLAVQRLGIFLRVESDERVKNDSERLGMTPRFIFFHPVAKESQATRGCA